MIELSVIMPVYNEQISWLEESIQSILNQTYSNFEFIIILDNPSNKQLENRILEYARLDSRIRFYKNQTNLGLVKTLNKALALSKGEFIARMDADDIALKERFEKQINYLKKNKDIHLIGTNWKCIDENSNIVFEHGKLPTNFNFIKKNLKYNNMFLHPSWMFRREVALEINGYREIEFCEDYDFISRLISNNLKISNINEFLMLYRVRNNSISLTKSFEQYKNSKKVIKFMNERKLNGGKDSFHEGYSLEYSDVEKENFKKATYFFIESRKDLSKKNIIGFLFKFMNSFFISQDRFRKNLDIIIFNFRLKIMKPY